MNNRAEQAASKPWRISVRGMMILIALTTPFLFVGRLVIEQRAWWFHWDKAVRRIVPGTYVRIFGKTTGPVRFDVLSIDRATIVEQTVLDVGTLVLVESDGVDEDDCYFESRRVAVKVAEGPRVNQVGYVVRSYLRLSGKQ